MKYQLKYTFTCCTVTWIVTSAIFTFRNHIQLIPHCKLNGFRLTSGSAKKEKEKKKAHKKQTKKQRHIFILVQFLMKEIAF